MKFASRFYILALCTSSVFCNVENRTFEHVLKDGQESLPVVIDWTAEKMYRYPLAPGIMTAAFLSKVKESFVNKRSSFLVWATLGALVFAEPYRLFAKEYLAQRAKQNKEVNFSGELDKAKENAIAAGQAVILAAYKGTQEIKEKITESIVELQKSNDSK